MLRQQSKFRRALPLVLSLGLAGSAAALELSTTNDYRNGSADAAGTGVFFDLTASTNVLLTGLGVFSNEATDPFEIEVYYRSGSYVGHQTVSTDWTPLQSFTQSPNGRNEIDPLFFSTELAMSRGETLAFYVAAISGGLRFDDSFNQLIVNNSDLTLTIHDPRDDANNSVAPGGTQALFQEPADTQQFAGTVYYRLPAAVPEPGSLALLGLGLLGLGLSRRRSHA